MWLKMYQNKSAMVFLSIISDWSMQCNKGNFEINICNAMRANGKGSRHGADADGIGFCSVG